MYRASVDSRFPDFGKLILLSFPRFKNDFIQQKYEEVISQKEVVIKTHTFILNPDLPEDEPGNKFSVQWEEDRIVAYKIPNVYALKRPTWEINPTRSIEDFKIEFYRNAEDALSRFACMPPEAVDAFFKSREKVEGAFNNPNLAVDDSGRFADWFKPLPDKEYFLHIDLVDYVKTGHWEALHGQVNWYDAATNGNKLVMFSNTFNSPILASTTIYYADCQALGCNSNRVQGIINVSNPCPQNLTVTSTTVSPFQATDYITTSGTIEYSSGSTSYKAGKAITILPPTTAGYWESKAGTVFEAKIEGCQ